jgi:hypothetical protein
MIFDIVGMIFDVIAQMFLFVFGIPLGTGVTYGGVIIVSSLVFGIATVVLNQFLDANKPVQEKKPKFNKKGEKNESKDN